MKLKNIKVSDFTSEKSDSMPEVEWKTVKNKRKPKRKQEDIPLGAPPKKKHKNNLSKPPTVEELNKLRETENLFNNNLFRLQIDELLSEVKIKNKRKSKLSSWLEEFTRFLNKLPAMQVLLSELPKLKNKKLEGTDFFLQKNVFMTDQDVGINFGKPESVQYFGLFENNCFPGPNITLSINLTMPKSSFLVKDFLNNRYLVKRYYYLLYVADFIKKAKLAGDLKIGFHDDDLLHHVIKLQPKNCDKTNIVIHVTPENNTFKPTRFLPFQNNMKLDLFDSNVDLTVLKETPTILYNNLLAHDVTLQMNNDFIKYILKDQSNIQDGIKLLCIWLNQRELNVGFGSFTENLLLYVIIYLLQKKIVNKFMSSYQIIRNFWNFLTTTDLLTEGISIGEVSSENMAKFKEQFSIVVLDKSSCWNVAALLHEETYKKVKLESETAIKYLDDNKNDWFNELFLTKMPFHHQYDILVDLSKSLPFDDKEFHYTESKIAKYIGYRYILTFNYVFKVLKKALNKRFFNLVSRIEFSGAEPKRFMFGINLNPDEAFTVIERGPALNDFEAAAEFRNFWGPLATDRRFKDGSTSVAVHFRTNTIKAKRNIVKNIVNFVFGEKFKMKFKIYYDEFEDVLISKRLVANYPSGTNEETSLKIILASDELNKMLRELQLTLHITGVHAMSDVFVYAQVFPPIPANFTAVDGKTISVGNKLIMDTQQKISKIPRYIQPIECVLQLEHSSKWPNDIRALRYLKSSFYLEISKLLNKHPEVVAYPSAEHLDVYFSGFVFRYKIFLSKEIALLKTIVTDNRDPSDNLNVSLYVLPQIIGGLRGIQSVHPSYGPGTALIKRWLRSHLIDEYHFSDIVIDLLNASLYLNDLRVQPNTPQMSFLRFLKFISLLDYDLQLIVVNFNDKLNAQEISEIQSKFQSDRHALPNLFILTPHDGASSIFTRKSPSKQILNRIKNLAKESLAFHDGVVVNQNRVGIKEVFIPNFEGYDVLIHLKSEMNPRRHQKITFSSVEDRIVIDRYKYSKNDRIPIVKFDPVGEYLKSLRENYGRYAVFFHDSYGGDVIGVLWHPNVYEVSEFNASKLGAGKIVDGKIKFNFDAVIEDFFVLGTDLVKNIERR